MNSLTPRQTQILQMIANGKTAKEIGYDLGISPATVRNLLMDDRASLGAYRRLGVSTAAQAVAEALRRGLIK